MKEIERLVKRFADRSDEYLSPRYSEAQLRIDFLNPMFELLGWDVANSSGLATGLREVITEPRQRVAEGTIEFPDYLFRLQGRPAFAVEAKKPSINLLTDRAPAVQLRRYGWNSGAIGLGIVSDFQEFAVYDCRVAPDPSDSPAKMRVSHFTYDQYLDAWDNIESLFSREAVMAGSLDGYLKSLTAHRGRQRVDQAFLSELDDWRRELAVAVARANTLTQDQLNRAVQLTIDRIVFLRICEDRGIEPYGELLADTEHAGVYRRLLDRFTRADEKYNSGLFHFRNERSRSSRDELTPRLDIPDDVLRNFIKRLYWPDGPYNFAVLPPDVLGHIYEQFLGKVITLDSQKKASVVEKPEVRKAGGVYYTPTSVVQHIVESTLGTRLSDENPDSLAKKSLTVCDPSCGSGSFLIEVYQYLLDWYLAQYESDAERWSQTRPRRIQEGAAGSWRLTTDERKRILTRHVFGVDIDPQAVEVTKLALLLKVLEGEDQTSLHAQTELFHQRVLPDLDANIKCGNSLVGNSFYSGRDDHLPLGVDEGHVNAFDWQHEFETVANGNGFDVLVGNPPWLMAGYYIDDTLPYLRANFVTAKGKFDLYYLFLEKALDLLAPEGELGMIVPNKFFHTSAARSLRRLLSETCRIESVEDFGLAQMFEGATNYSCILRLSKSQPSGSVGFAELDADLQPVRSFRVDQAALEEKAWVFQDEDARRVFHEMRDLGVPLEDVVSRFGTGVQSGSDTVLSMSEERARELGLEAELLRRMLRGRDVRAYTVAPDPRLLIFPYIEEGGAFRLLSPTEMKAFPQTWAYLKQHKQKLSSRVWFGKSAVELSGEWYGLMYVEALSTVQARHVLTPSLSNGSNFALGDHSLWATGTAGVTALVPSGECAWSIQALLGILNSSPLSLFANEHSPIYQGGFHKFSAPYLRGLPIPPRLSGGDGERQDRAISALVETITQSVTLLRRGLDESERTRVSRREVAARDDLDREVMDAFHLDQRCRDWVLARRSLPRPS